MYWLQTPKIVQKMMPTGLWQKESDNDVFLTFDDGPHPQITPFVLAQLKAFHAKATFFCLGKNVAAHPDVLQQIKADGHSVGNHTYDHLNGWETSVGAYLTNVEKAIPLIDSALFRPPYGRIRHPQANRLHKLGLEIVYWSLLSGDFDLSITPEKCLNNVLSHIKPGAVVLFHDSEKAFPRMRYALPKVLAYCAEQGWGMKGL